MKKIIIGLVLGVLFGCSSTQTCVQVSPVAKRTMDGKHIYFLDNETGSMVYRLWTTGVYGNDTIPHLVDSMEFVSIPSITSTSFITNQTSNSTVVNH